MDGNLAPNASALKNIPQSPLRLTLPVQDSHATARHNGPGRVKLAHWVAEWMPETHSEHQSINI